MKEIKTEHYIDIYPFVDNESPPDIITMVREPGFLTRVTAFPDGRVHLLGQTFKIAEAEQIHLALGRAIELAGGWKK